MDYTYTSPYINQMLTYRRSLLDREFTVWQYCNRWIPLFYGLTAEDRGFKEACLRELSEVTGVERDSISSNWGAEFERTPKRTTQLIKAVDFQNYTLYYAKHLPKGFLEGFS